MTTIERVKLLVQAMREAQEAQARCVETFRASGYPSCVYFDHQSMQKEIDKLLLEIGRETCERSASVRPKGSSER